MEFNDWLFAARRVIVEHADLLRGCPAADDLLPIVRLIDAAEPRDPAPGDDDREIARCADSLQYLVGRIERRLDTGHPAIDYLDPDTDALYPIKRAAGEWIRKHAEPAGVD